MTVPSADNIFHGYVTCQQSDKVFFSPHFNSGAVQSLNPLTTRFPNSMTKG